MMATKPGYAVANYINVTQLDKILTVDYWKEYDGLTDIDSQQGFSDWYIKQATPPDNISRAIRWLVSHNYLLLKPEVQERAMEAASKWRQSIRH